MTREADGRALGVQGTPTFFLNGSRIQPHSLEDLSTAFDKALAEFTAAFLKSHA